MCEPESRADVATDRERDEPAEPTAEAAGSGADGSSATAAASASRAVAYVAVPPTSEKTPPGYMTNVGHSEHRQTDPSLLNESPSSVAIMLPTRSGTAASAKFVPKSMAQRTYQIWSKWTTARKKK